MQLMLKMSYLIIAKSILNYKEVGRKEGGQERGRKEVTQAGREVGRNGGMKEGRKEVGKKRR